MNEIYIKRKVPFELYEIALLDANDEQMLRISKESGIGLSLEEMKKVKEYFSLKGRNPTDVEFQSIGQAWSEHCCYKSSKLVLKKFFAHIDNKEVIAREDAGVMEFDDRNAYALRIESHNHPSAIEPYGGAATGIGGIVRDVLCMGSQPIALIDPLFFGPLNLDYKKLPVGIKHPKYLFAGVVAGIRDYGNRIGIPTCAGSVCFDSSYTGNCIVNVGCVGIGKKKNLIHSSVGGIGDLLVLVGGRTGRDGIHGVTFASAVLTEKSELESRGSVQLGNPIVKEPLIHACLEAVERGLVSGMKDLGGGGLSCVVGEMAYAKNLGAEVLLDKVPLKEESLAPWEIWVSESQERMMLSVKQKNLSTVLKIFNSWDVDATVIGNVIGEKLVRIFYNKTLVYELETDFLVNAPVYRRPKRKTLKRAKKEGFPVEPKNYTDILMRIISHPNIASKDWVIRQYDHEVRGATAVKPLQGNICTQVHGDATVLKPLEDSYRGLAISVSSNPSYASAEPFKAGKSVIDEVCRNIVSVGARPHSITNCLNFGSPEKPEIMYDFYETARGMGAVCEYLGLPIPSGNVSFYNESREKPIKATAVVLGVGIIDDIRSAVTVDIKSENPIYLIGETKGELGGSIYYETTEAFSENVPDVNIEVLTRSIDALLSASKSGYIAACHDISHGGLATCISEMCIGGNIGAAIDLSHIGNLRTDFKLFSESNTRWLVEVKKGYERKFVNEIKNVGVYKIGTACGEILKIKDCGREIVNIPVNELRDAWNKPIWELMG